MSTGMNTINSIKKSVNIIKKNKIPLVLLHCTNIYPTPEKFIRLDCITELKKAFPNTLVGLSDHSKSIYPCIAAFALGASVVEKHFINDRKKDKGPDASSSMDYQELKNLVKASRIVFQSRGSQKKVVSIERSTIKFAFSSVVSMRTIEKGEKLNKHNICLKRPGNGDFNLDNLTDLYGKIVRKRILKNFQIKKRDLS